MRRCPKLFFVTLTFITCLCLIESRQLTEIEVLQRTTCETVYKKAQGNRKDISFKNPIGNLSCKPGPNGFIRYHCMEDEDGHFLQFCAEWIWIEPRLCPKLYSLQGIINPVECDKTKGCPTERYQSHEYYKYHACFNITKKNEGMTEKQGKPENPKSEGQFGDGVMIALIVIVTVITAITVGILFFQHVLWRRDHFKENTSFKGKVQPSACVERARPLVEAKNHLDDGKCILITGKKGEGVSTFIPSLHGTHYSSYKLKKVDYSFDRINASKKLFLMTHYNYLDDNEFDGLLNLINRPDRKTKIVIDVTRSRYVELKQRFDRACPNLVAGMDLSSDYLKMTFQERKELITIFFKKSRIRESELSDKQRSQIAILIEFESSEYGFSHVCDRFFEVTSRGELINRLNDAGGALERFEERTTEQITREPLNEAGVRLQLLGNGEAI